MEEYKVVFPPIYFNNVLYRIIKDKQIVKIPQI